ncbi:UPF0104 family protein [candidate division WWE3 bacterium]|jgi:uncharacterized membrane protein YbhN (UPF0104 family)|uniref:UPF0104 family protein n=1 Tax=candidate division WWE3 bacterium TaxID=2053526 RepID=A0A3A4ZAS3_UNCKA|nr:MAG: UPF0104 family protein [candidate division WWE3 bacterium]
MIKKLLRYNKSLLKTFVSVGLVLYLLTKISFQDVVYVLNAIDYSFIPLTVIFLLIGVILHSVSNKLLLEDNNSKVKLETLVFVNLIKSYLDTYLFPKTSGNEYRKSFLSKKFHSDAAVGHLILVEPSLKKIAFLIIMLIGSIWYTRAMSLIFVLWLVLGWVFYRIILNTLAPINNEIKDLRASFNWYLQKRKRVLSYVFLISSLIMQICAQYVLLLSTGIFISPLGFLVISALIGLLMLTIPSFGGIGLQDFLYVVLLLFFSVPAQVALAVSITYHFSKLGISLIGGFIHAKGKV